MLSPAVLMWIVVILLILMAAPLLGALTTNTSIAGLTSVWIALLALLAVAAIVSIARSVMRAHSKQRDKAA